MENLKMERDATNRPGISILNLATAKYQATDCPGILNLNLTVNRVGISVLNII
jgi:hypothetical protein